MISRPAPALPSRGAILFDFGGTLDGDGVRWAVRFHEAYRAAGGTLPLEPFEVHFRRTDAELAELPGIRAMGFRQMVEAQARLLVRRVDDGAALDAGRIAEHFHRESLEAVRRNRLLLASLGDRPLGIVSNFTGNLDRCLDELELGSLFGVTCDSAVIGCTKPDAAIFRAALSALGVEPGDAWMVGDNFEADVRPAAALGMRTCWIAPAERPAPAEGVATMRAARLADFLVEVA
jgi:putative hydrolase of the HAD superfamily